MVTTNLKNPENNHLISVKSNKVNITYNYVINEIKHHTDDLNVYISVESIDEKGLGALINPLDLFYGKIGEMVPKINFLSERYIGGWIKINQYGIYHTSEADINECKTIIIKF